MEDCCVVCAEPLRWVAIGPCRHRDVCSMCVARLRIVMNDRRCCICKQDCPAVVVTKALGEYTRCSYDFSILPGAVKKPGLSGGDFWYEPTMHAYFDDEDHFKTMAAMTRLACRVCQGDAPPSAMDAAAAAAAAATAAASARADAAAAEATSGGAGEGSGRGGGAGGRGGNGGRGRGGKGGGRGGKVLGGSVPLGFSFPHVNPLKAHLQQSHRLGMCDLCLEGRKVFVCEQRLYTRRQLERHAATGDAEPDREAEASEVWGGFRGHPRCEFCVKRFYGENELYQHMSVEHYTCHICQRCARGAMRGEGKRRAEGEGQGNQEVAEGVRDGGGWGGGLEGGRGGRQERGLGKARGGAGRAGKKAWGRVWGEEGSFARVSVCASHALPFPTILLPFPPTFFPLPPSRLSAPPRSPLPCFSASSFPCFPAPPLPRFPPLSPGVVCLSRWSRAHPGSFEYFRSYDDLEVRQSLKHSRCCHCPFRLVR
ncbi:unnamed protein product [Closterium sp. NIES-53]